MIKNLKTKFHKWEFLIHHTKKKVLLRFLLVFLVIISYFIYVSLKFGTKKGFFVTLLTWSFFVFCTPIADAGFLLDFPLRLLLHIRMLFSEISVWVIATIINGFAIIFYPQLYDSTILLKLLHTILTTPLYWLIIILSLSGTLFSVLFADELIDVSEEKHRKLHKKHHLKLQLIIFVTLFFFVFILYHFLLKKLAINIPLF